MVLVKLITGEKIERSIYKKLPVEQRNLLKKRPLTIESLREGRKAVFTKYNHEDGLEKKDDYKPDITLDAILHNCGESYAIEGIKKAEMSDNTRRKRLFLIGLILCAGTEYAKAKEIVDDFNVRKLYDEGIL